MPYVYFTDEQKLRANAVDLVDFLQRRGEKLIASGHDKRLASNKSITIRGNEWYDHSDERGGHSVDFLQEFYDLSYPDAVTALLGEHGMSYSPAPPKRAQELRKPFALPPVNSDMRRVYAYLIKQRFINRDVLTHFAKVKTIYEDAEHHNAVFVGTDENGIPRHAHKKSTNTYGCCLSASASISPTANTQVPLKAPPELSSLTRPSSFRINVEGSNPAYSFHHTGQSLSGGASDRLYVFEAPIDMLSFISLYPQNWQEHSYVCLCGVAEHAMLKMLEVNPQLQQVVLCLDHDAAGIEGNQRLTDTLREHGYDKVGILQSKYKDWNEDLKAKNGIAPAPAEEHPQLIALEEICGELPELMQRCRNADCDAAGLRGLFDQMAVHNHAGRFEQSGECLKKLTALSLLAAKKQYVQMGKSVTDEQLVEHLRRSFRPHQNKGKYQSRMAELQSGLAVVFGRQGVITQTEKIGLAREYQNLALSGVKTMVTVEVETQKIAQQETPAMSMTM